MTKTIEVESNDNKEEEKRIFLSGSIKLRRTKNSYSESDFEEFSIEETFSKKVEESVSKKCGSSCICYKATRFFGDSMSETGMLKEFYPVDQEGAEYSYNLKRHDIDEGNLANQLYCDELTFDNFTRARDEFLECYKEILKIKKENGENDNFYAPFDIYYGVTDQGQDDNYTIYIWTPGDSTLKSFDDYLDQMQSRICNEIEAPSMDLSLFLARELHMILQTIKALALGIEKLHTADYLHLDIKPSNFGMRNLGIDNGDNISVSLFDVNSICSQRNTNPLTAGTENFSSPELRREKYAKLEIGCQSDVYSLGATLYNSIIVIDKNNRGLYDDDNFTRIDTDLRYSQLIEFSGYNLSADIFDKLSSILKRSLARNYEVENYQSVGAFIKDITEVDQLLTKDIGIANVAGSDNKAELNIIDKEKYFAKKAEGGAASIMQRILYENPLYNYTENGVLKVLVLGAGVFGQKFIDTAFELSQIKNCYLDITVVSKDGEADEKRYLETRPEFENFFFVDDKKPKHEDFGAYGSIRFIKLSSEFSPDFSHNSDHNLDILKSSLNPNESSFGYVFISMFDENLNKKLAYDLCKSKGVLAKKAMINFITYEEIRDGLYGTYLESAKRRNIKLNAVNVADTLKKHKDYRFLTQMAFNCHLLYTGYLSNLDDSYREFRMPYNFTSSFANALSIKYKLHSIKEKESELELDHVIQAKDEEKKEVLHKLTMQFKRKIGIGENRTNEQEACLNELTMYEHRRWVVNKICNSYTVIAESEYTSLKSTNKDEAKRKHTCIVPSRAEWTLHKDYWVKDLSKWNDEKLEENKEFFKLDPLDKVSIMLHRRFKKVADDAEKIDKDSLRADSDTVRRLLREKPVALAAFNEYLISLNSLRSIIKDGEKNVKRERAKNLKRAADESLKAVTENLDETFAFADEVKKKLENIKKIVAPLMLAAQYTDYKSNDQTLIHGIPFILNYTADEKLCIPFVKSKSNNEWFRNVASAMVINPKTITYLLSVENLKNETSEIVDILSNVTRLMDKHRLQAQINLIVYVKTKTGKIIPDERSTYTEKFKEASSRIHSVNFVAVSNQRELATRIQNTFATNQKTKSKFSAIELNREFISGAICSVSGLSAPTYEFDSTNQIFRTEDNADEYIWFSDISFDVHLYIEDMFISHGKLSTYHEPELQQDYIDIWKKCYYIDNDNERPNKIKAWKKLCAAIKEKVEKSNKALSIDISKNDINKANLTTTELFVPAFCRGCIEKLFSFFSSEKINIMSDCKICDHNSSMLKISFHSTNETKEQFIGLFKNLYALSDETRIKTVSTGRYANVFLDSLIVTDFSLDSINDAKVQSAAQESFDYLVEKGYIIKLCQPNDSGHIDFCFASPQIKELLTKEGQLLELYTYYQTVQTGYFDEVKTGLEVQRKKDENEYVQTQEFDLITVKGFRTQFVEVKARQKLEQGFYQKLKSNGDNFGINKSLVLVSHFGENSDHSPENMDFIDRGKEDYDVQTVYENKEIKRVGKTLEEKMEFHKG